MAITDDDTAIEQLENTVRGNLISPNDPEFDDARAIYNAMIDKQPQLIARCENVADVLAAVEFAREHGLETAVRNGGHNGAGLATVYEATQLGSFVVAGMQELIDRLDTEQTFRDIWRWLPTEASGFTLEMWADAVVTTAESADPYRPVNQFLSLLQDTDRFRFVGFTLALLEPCMEDLCQRISEGMEAEIIDHPSVVEYIRTTYPDQSAEALESGNLTVPVHDDLPSYGVGIVDNRVAVSGYDPDSGTVQVLIETDAPEAREWAESIYRSYRRENPTLALERPDS